MLCPLLDVISILFLEILKEKTFLHLGMQISSLQVRINFKIQELFYATPSTIYRPTSTGILPNLPPENVRWCILTKNVFCSLIKIYVLVEL